MTNTYSPANHRTRNDAKDKHDGDDECTEWTNGDDDDDERGR